MGIENVEDYEIEYHNLQLNITKWENILDNEVDEVEIIFNL